jgi:hypothetical protein
VGVGVVVGVEVAVGVGVCVLVGVGVNVAVAVGVGVLVGVGVNVAVAVGVGVFVAVGVGVALGVSVGTGVFVGLGVFVNVGVNVAVAVGVGVFVNVGVAVGRLTGAPLKDTLVWLGTATVGLKAANVASAVTVAPAMMGVEASGVRAGGEGTRPDRLPGSTAAPRISDAGLGLGEASEASIVGEGPAAKCHSGWPPNESRVAKAISGSSYTR